MGATMKKMFVLLGIAAMIFFAPNVFAKETKDMQGIFEECGIGALLFPKWPIGASVSNFTWDLGTTASTSGLTTPDACAGGKAKLAAYIYKTYDSIEKDLANGNGEHLDTLAHLAGKNQHEKDSFILEVRHQFLQSVEKNNYSSMDQLEKAKAVYAIVDSLS